MSRDQLIAQVNEEFDTLLASIDGLSDERMLEAWFGDWSVRDILAHVSGWHREMTALLERMARGERPAPEGVDYSDSDGWNARFAERHKDTGPAAMREELTASKEAFVTAARVLPEDRFEEGRTGQRVLTTTGFNHYREHALVIREWRQREGI
jgi:hypothetical protein